VSVPPELTSMRKGHEGMGQGPSGVMSQKNEKAQVTFHPQSLTGKKKKNMELFGLTCASWFPSSCRARDCSRFCASL